MKTDLPQPIRLEEYTPPAYRVDAVDLTFDLEPGRTTVKARLAVRRADGGDPSVPLVLDGEALELLALSVDGAPLAAADYDRTDETLTLFNLPDACTVETEVAIDPAANTRLEGLYVSNGMFCTQCEAEGFRRITYYPDRPDVMALGVHHPDRGGPEQVSGAAVERQPRSRKRDLGELDGNHFVLCGVGRSVPQAEPICSPWSPETSVWSRTRINSITGSGREVNAAHLRRTRQRGYAAPMPCDSLIKSMAWDEEVFGLEYDLDIFYMIVAVE